MPDLPGLLDTPVLIDLLRGISGARAFTDALPAEDRCLSVVTVAELLCGARSRREHRLIEAECRQFALIHIDAAASARALELYLAHHFENRNFLDHLIAAIALTQGRRVITLDTDFGRIGDLEVQLATYSRTK